MSLKLNSANGSITITPEDGSGDVTATLPRGGIGDVFTTDIGSTVQAFDADTAKYDAATSNFTGTLQYDGNEVLSTADVGVNVQAYNANYAVLNGVTQNFTGTLQNGGSDVLVDTDIGSTVQAYDADTAKLDVAQTFAEDQIFPNVILTGYLAGPASFTIDPAAIGDDTGTVIIAGNLQVDGTTTTVNSTTMDVADLNITIAHGAANPAAADGAGITVDGASATILYTASTDSWDFNKPLSGTYNNLHGVVSTITTVIDFDQPINKLTMGAGVTFTESNKAEGKACLLKLETAGNTPTFSANIKWAGDEEPAWADHGYWVISFICDDATNVFASATGHTI